ncbi:MAG: NUDIX hydrolase [Calditrichaceae bacterium]|nr:NUDIX hydrolase [Calditrichaceae bacterium]HES58813.1 NUDIX domain-containing protein [Caldithrix sp.]
MNGNIKPVAAVGAVVFNNGCVLLVKRKNPPAKGQWAIPGGKIMTGERMQETAEREIFEETSLVIKAGNPVFSFDVIERDENGKLQFHYVIIDLIAEYLSGDIKARDDAIEARWIAKKELSDLKINPNTRYLLKEKFDFY